MIIAQLLLVKIEEVPQLTQAAVYYFKDILMEDAFRIVVSITPSNRNAKTFNFSVSTEEDFSNRGEMYIKSAEEKKTNFEHWLRGYRIAMLDNDKKLG